VGANVKIDWALLPSMTERQRVFLALQGKRFPHVGARGLFTSFRRHGKKWRAQVEVVRVSLTGQTIWTRFVTENAQHELGLGLETHRWWRLAPMRYRAGGDSVRAPPGDISFPNMMPEDAI
jgi:hypothetical protein